MRAMNAGARGACFAVAIAAAARLAAALPCAALLAFAAEVAHAATATDAGGPAPSFLQVRAAYRPSDLTLVDRRGAPLHRLRLDPAVRRLDWVPLSAVSPALKAALVAAEDKRFEAHDGVDWAAAAQAAWDNLKGRVAGERRTLRGASTLTMQLAALLDPALRPEAGERRDLSRKWDQAKAAWAIEKHWTKAEIFEAYLNLVPLRGDAVGIAAASEVWFGKRPDGLDLAEAALLAALVRAPQASPQRTAERACRILDGFDVAAGSGSAASDASVVAKGDALPGSRPDCATVAAIARTHLARPLFDGRAGGPQLAPHAARQVRAELVEHAAKPAVKRDPAGPAALTLDARLQSFVASRLQQHLRELAGRNVEDGAAVVLDNATGEVLAWVGSSGLLSDAPEVDGVIALRQAGSTLKPFLYALAIDRRILTAASLIDDSPLALTAENGVYVPQNYDRQFRGLVSARSALASSFNVPAVRTLLLVGPDRFHEALRRFGFATLDQEADYYGLALALGSADIRLLDLANAYRALANGGRWSPVAPLRVRSPGAAQDPKVAAAPRRVVGAPAAYVVADILSDRGARAPAFGLENPLATRVWAAVKTGTSKDMRDNWAVGFTDRYTVAAWVGNFSGAPMWNVSGVQGAAPLWRDVVHYLHEQSAPSRHPKAPPGLEQVAVQFDGIDEAPRREWFLPGTAMAVVTATAGGDPAAPRIVYPANGLIVALDPDIPHAVERIPLRRQPEGGDFKWRLERTGTGASPCRIEPTDAAWAPSPGQWRLSLRDRAGRELDAVSFTVRGTARHEAACVASVALE
jgi:penicillin-binding protein 1C